MDIYDEECIEEEGKNGSMTADFLEHDHDLGEKQRQNFTKALHAGVKLSFGTDAGVCEYDRSINQFAFMVKYGMTPMQAIQSATTKRRRPARQIRNPRQPRPRQIRRHRRRPRQPARRHPRHRAHHLRHETRQNLQTTKLIDRSLCRGGACSALDPHLARSAVRTLLAFSSVRATKPNLNLSHPSSAPPPTPSASATTPPKSTPPPPSSSPPPAPSSPPNSHHASKSIRKD